MSTPRNGQEDILGYASAAPMCLANDWQPLPPLNSDRGVVPPGFTGYTANTVTEHEAHLRIDNYHVSGVALHLTMHGDAL